MNEARPPGTSQLTDRSDDVIIPPPTNDASSYSTSAITMKILALVLNTILYSYSKYPSIITSPRITWLAVAVPTGTCTIM